MIVAGLVLMLSSTALAHQDTDVTARLDGQGRATGGTSFEMDAQLISLGLYEAEPMLSIYACEAFGVAGGGAGGFFIAGFMTCELGDGLGPAQLEAIFLGEVDATLAFHLEGDIDEGRGSPHDLTCDGQATPTDASGTSFSLSGTCSID